MYLFVVAVSLFYIIKVGMSDVCVKIFYLKHCNNLVQIIILLNYAFISCTQNNMYNHVYVLTWVSMQHTTCNTCWLLYNYLM